MGNRFIRAVIAALVLGPFGLGCEANELRLSIDLRTDFVAAEQFDQVEVRWRLGSAPNRTERIAIQPTFQALEGDRLTTLMVEVVTSNAIRPSSVTNAPA